MALSKKALQAKREKKKKKRQIKAPTSSLSTAIAYHHWPIHECWIPVELWDKGMGQVIIARKNSQGDIAVGAYLLDVYCLGVKDCFIRLTNSYDYQNILQQLSELCGEFELAEPSYVNTLILKAVEYADQLGFKPQGDFVKAKNFLKGIPVDDNQTFIFGQDGKPCYVQGIIESHADVKRILKTLELNQGAGNYTVIAEL